MEEDAILILNGIAGTPGGIRTPDLLLRRQPLYPSELQAHALGSLTRDTLGVKIPRIGPATCYNQSQICGTRF